MKTILNTVCSFIPESYHEWKKQRKEMINKIKPEIINLKEHELTDLYQILTKKILDHRNKGNESSLVQKLVIFYVIIYFFREYDLLKHFLIYFENI